MTETMTGATPRRGGLILKGCLYFLTVLSAVTGLTVYVGGGATLPGIESVPATVDGELRFYGPYWMFFGALAVWVALGLEARKGWVPVLAGVLFASGAGRALSYVLVGPPAPMFVPIMIFELVFPLVMLLLWRAQTRG